MFWGLTLEAGKHYSQSVEGSFHVSMAALELNYDSKDKHPRAPVQVMVQHQKKDFLLCSLLYGTLVQQQLDLDFTEGEQITFYLEGTGVVHLTGYLVQEKLFEAEDEPILGSPPDSSEDGMEVSDDDDSDSKEDLDETIPSLQQLATGKDLESDDESGEDWVPVLQQKEATKKRKLVEGKNSSKKKKKAAETTKKEEESSDEEDEDITNEMADLFEDIDAHDSSQENGKREKEERGQSSPEKEESGDGEKTSPKKKKKKKKKQPAEGSQPGATPQRTNQNKATNEQTPGKSKKKLSNGVLIEDIVVGDGKLARPLKMVGVYYRGTVAGKKQEFDSCLSGKPFLFRLGTKEVISGWDSGLSGMRVGGKRKLTIPPSQGYGKSRAGSIPPNSTLVFDVELKEVK